MRRLEGRAWAREPEERRTDAAERYAAWRQERQDARAELRIELWWSADLARRLHAIGARTGLTLEQLLAQLADCVQLNDDGTPAVALFAPR
ncbi:hypothetical protein N7U49_47285 [Streptomyces sp. AD2-2]|nr:hypothetical protein N7U49_47285 [Streptomyces sp. AD2-2]